MLTRKAADNDGFFSFPKRSGLRFGENEASIGQDKVFFAAVLGQCVLGGHPREC